MENQNTCYEVKLNRWLNIQSKQNLILLAVLIALPVAYIIINAINNTIDWKYNVIFSCGCVVIMIVKLLSGPKCLDVTPETIKFQYRGALFHLLTIGRLRINSNNDTAYGSTHTLYNIKSIEYSQTSFEKIFSCGHICVNADVNIKSNKEQRTFVIYGVKDFENTSAWMKGYINPSKEK